MEIMNYAETRKCAMQLLDILTDNKYSRKKQDSRTHLENIIRSSIVNDATLEFMGLWGGSKEGNYGDERDSASLSHLEALQRELRHVYRKTDVTLLFCNLHHMLVNGIPYEETRKYLFYLSQVSDWIAIKPLHDLLGETQGTIQSIDQITDFDSRERTEQVLANLEAAKILTTSAMKHSRLVGDLRPQEIARIYVEVEIYFLRKLITENRIFFSFSSPEIQEPIAQAAEIPMLYLTPYGTKEHRVPWYNIPNNSD